MSNALRMTEAELADRATRLRAPQQPDKRPRFRLTAPTPAQIKRATRPKEIQIHCAYVAWTRRMCGYAPALSRGFHPANGEERDAKTGAKLARMGVRKGVLDWWLPVARGGYGGLVLEFKRPGEKPTAEQHTEIVLLRAEGYCVAVFDDWDCAAQYTLDYLAGNVVPWIDAPRLDSRNSDEIKADVAR